MAGRFFFPFHFYVFQRCDMEVCVFGPHSSTLTFDLRYFKYVVGPAFETVAIRTFSYLKWSTVFGLHT